MFINNFNFAALNWPLIILVLIGVIVLGLISWKWWKSRVGHQRGLDFAERISRMGGDEGRDERLRNSARERK